MDTAIRFEAGLADPKSSFLQGTVAVRLHDMIGHPIGYCGRRLNTDAISRWGKWRFPTYLPKGQLLYNAQRALAAKKRGIVLVEFPRAAMRLTRAGIAVSSRCSAPRSLKPNSPGLQKPPLCCCSWTPTRQDAKQQIRSFKRYAKKPQR